MKKLFLFFSIISIISISNVITYALPSLYIKYDYLRKSYLFYNNNQILYEYSLTDYTGTLGALKVFTDFETFFRPSTGGSPKINFAGTEKYLWEDKGITKTLVSHTLINPTTLKVVWKVTLNNTTLIYQYSYQFLYISPTKIDIEVKEEASSQGVEAVSFELDRCENAVNPRVISIPYLTLFNILLCNNKFTSLYADWNKTNASELIPMPYSIFDSTENPNTSKRFSHLIIYNPKYDPNTHRQVR